MSRRLFLGVQKNRACFLVFHPFALTVVRRDHRLFPQAYRERLHTLEGTDEETAGGRSRLLADLISGLT